ncbi:MAG: hypothetical protein RR220_06655 [Bacteroidaceae bacterium]
MREEEKKELLEKSKEELIKAIANEMYLKEYYMKKFEEAEAHLKAVGIIYLSYKK